MHGLIYLIGLIVVILPIPSFSPTSVPDSPVFVFRSNQLLIFAQTEPS